VIDLPDFDHGILDRVASNVEDAAHNMRDLADGRRNRVIDNDEIVVRIQRQLLGIERSFRDPSSAPQCHAR
jgi:hypothetical protein